MRTIIEHGVENGLWGVPGGPETKIREMITPGEGVGWEYYIINR